MSASRLLDRVKVAVTSAPGTGAFALGPAVLDAIGGDCRSFSAGGVNDNDLVTYLAVEGHKVEVGQGVYSAGGQTLSRAATPSFSTAGAGAETFGTAVTVALVAGAADLAQIPDYALSVMSGIASGDATLTLPQVIADTRTGKRADFTTNTYRSGLLATTSYTQVAGVSVSRASTAVASSVSGVVSEFAAGTPRITDKGLLIEGAATNQVRNPRAEGGSSSASPTNWSFTGGSGVTVTPVGVSTITGVQGMSYDVSGVATANTSLSLLIDTGITAAAADTWTLSNYIAVLSGSVSNINVNLRATYAGSGSLTGPDTHTSITATPARLSYTSTAAPGTTALSPRIVFQILTGTSYSFRIWVGWPQAVLWPFATSSVLPPAASPSASTRAADVITEPDTLPASFFRKFNLDTLVGSTGADQTITSWDDGTANNVVALYVQASDAHLHLKVTAGGTAQCDLDLGLVAASTDYTVAASLGATVSASVNQATAISSTGGLTMPTVTTNRLGHQLGPAKFAYGRIKRRDWSPIARTTTQLQTAA